MPEKLPDKLPIIGDYGGIFAADGTEMDMNDIARKYNTPDKSRYEKEALHKEWQKMDSYRKGGLAD